MLKPDPSQKRQAAEGGLTVLWRERQGGGREGLALLANACSNPGCECREVVVDGWLTASAQFHAHGPARALLKRVWAERQPLAALLIHRQKKMRELAPEIHRLFVKTSPAKVGPNEQCPCGSGKKYKRCCMSKR